MNYFLKGSFSLAFLLAVSCSFAQKRDTLTITPNNLNKKGIHFGDLTYVVYTKKTKQSPSEGIYLAKINVAPKDHNNKQAIAITQQWDRGDTVGHSAFTLLDAADLSTLFHETYWKRLGYSTVYDFETKKVYFNGNVTDSAKTASINDFNGSFSSYNLNWHSDLVIFTLLPFKENRSFKIHLFDPGFGKATDEIYSVTGSDVLTTATGNKIDCWILENTPAAAKGGYQRFWVDKKNTVILKEEDFFNNNYRYKLKLEVSENN